MPAKKEDGDKATRVLISMNPIFLAKIDDLATKEQRTRSELIREAIRQYITRNQRPEPKEDQQIG